MGPKNLIYRTDRPLSSLVAAGVEKIGIPSLVFFLPIEEAMEIPQGDLDRVLFFEYARKQAETNYAKNPLDADVCPLSL